MWNKTFDLFSSGVGSVGSLLGTVGGRNYGSVSYYVSYDAVAYIARILKTPILYDDSNVLEVAYQVRDALGRGQVSTSLLSIHMLISYGSGVSSRNITVECEGPSEQGVGVCTTTVLSTWFSASLNRTVFVVVLALSGTATLATSSVATITLWQSPTYKSLSSAGMVLSLPHHPVFAGDIVTFRISANTSGNALVVWGLTINFDAKSLIFLDISTNELFLAVTYNLSPFKMKISCSGWAAGTAYLKTVSSDLYLVSIRFQVSRLLSTPQVLTNVVSFTVDDMINQFSFN